MNRNVAARGAVIVLILGVGVGMFAGSLSHGPGAGRWPRSPRRRNPGPGQRRGARSARRRRRETVTRRRSISADPTAIAVGRHAGADPHARAHAGPGSRRR